MKTLTKVFSVWCCSLLMVTLAFSADNTEEKLRLEQERLPSEYIKQALEKWLDKPTPYSS